MRGLGGQQGEVTAAVQGLLSACWCSTVMWGGAARRTPSHIICEPSMGKLVGATRLRGGEMQLEEPCDWGRMA